MNEEPIREAKDKMAKSLENLDHRFATVRAGRANPSSLDTVMVEYYGTPTPLKQLATISIPEARQLCIRPFDKGCLAEIEKGILKANLGYTPNNDGETIRIIVPELTEERRRELQKQVKALAEECKVAIRNARQDANKEIERLELPVDEEKGKMKQIQDLVNDYNKLVEEKLKEKEEELMTV